jgi:RNA polymerase sigma factor (sigma-70 family)
MSARGKRRDVQAGDRPLSPVVWGRLYGAFYPPVRSGFVAKVASEQDADDLAEEVFARLARAGLTDDPKAHIAGLALSVLRRYRRRRAKEHAALRKLLMEAMRTGEAELERGEPSNDGGFTAEARLIMDELLAGLPAGQVKLLKLRFVDGLRVAEVALRVGCSRAAAYKRIQRIVTQLRRKYGADPNRPKKSQEEISSYI